jgi:hypothetical protein
VISAPCQLYQLSLPYRQLHIQWITRRKRLAITIKKEILLPASGYLIELNSTSPFARKSPAW